MSAGFDIGVSSEEVVYDIPFGFDDDGKVNAAIQVVSKNSQKYRDAERAISRTALKKSAVRGRPLDLKKDSDSDELLDQRDATNVALATAVTVGWYGLTNGDVEYAYSPDAAKFLYEKNTIVRDKVLAAIEDQANFLKR